MEISFGRYLNAHLFTELEEHLVRMGARVGIQNKILRLRISGGIDRTRMAAFGIPTLGLRAWAFPIRSYLLPNL